MSTAKTTALAAPPASSLFDPRPGFEVLGGVVASVDVLAVLAAGGWTIGDVLSRHLINRNEATWETDLEIPGAGYVRLITLTGGGVRPSTYLSTDGEEVLPGHLRVAPAVTLSFYGGASREDFARAKGRRKRLDRFGQEMKEA